MIIIIIIIIIIITTTTTTVKNFKNWGAKCILSREEWKRNGQILTK